jgi:hypothetical protein
MGWTVPGSNPDRSEIFRTRPERVRVTVFMWLSVLLYGCIIVILFLLC